MAAKLDAAAWAEMIRLFQTPGELTAELQAARAQAAAQHTEAAQPVDDLTTRIADAERRLASLRKMAELVESDDQVQALAARITLARLLRYEHVLTAVEDAGTVHPGEDGGTLSDCDERALACSRMSTPVSTRRSGALRPLRNSAM